MPLKLAVAGRTGHLVGEVENGPGGRAKPWYDERDRRFSHTFLRPSRNRASDRGSTAYQLIQSCLKCSALRSECIAVLHTHWRVESLTHFGSLRVTPQILAINRPQPTDLHLPFVPLKLAVAGRTSGAGTPAGEAQGSRATA